MANDAMELDLDADNCLKMVFVVPPGKEDVTNPSVPGGPTVRPERLVVLVTPGGSNGTWIPSIVTVVGPTHLKKGLSKRPGNVTFMDLHKYGHYAPDWVRETALDCAALMNAGTVDA